MPGMEISIEALRQWFGESKHMPFLHVAYSVGFVASDATWRTPGEIFDAYDFGDLYIAALGVGVTTIEELDERLGQAVDHRQTLVALRSRITDCAETPVAMPHDIVVWLLLLSDPRGSFIATGLIGYTYFNAYAILAANALKFGPKPDALPAAAENRFPGYPTA